MNLNKYKHLDKTKSNPYGRGKYIDLTNQYINSFKVIKRIVNKISKNGKDYFYWEAICNCGNTFNITAKQIYRNQKSCGCLKLKGKFRRSLTDEQASLRQVLYRYKLGAKRRNLEWGLSEEQAFNLFNSFCYYCNQSPSKLTPKLTRCKSRLYNGIDRMNNKIGYKQSNCVSCCTICNRAKLNLNFKDFIQWLNRLVIYRTTK